jgi:hypothetical protein
MIRTTVSMGDGPYGPSVMKFTLTYDGELRSNGKPRHKWEIRQQIHPQLAELWQISPALRYVSNHRWVARSGNFGIPVLHHSAEDHGPGSQRPPTDGNWINVCEPIAVKGKRFVPLVRESLSLRCGLKITYLRKEDPGNLIFQGGDLDNRIKTLFDALSMPNMDQMIDDPNSDDTIYCLLEDDRLISGCSIETQRLLSNRDASEHDVRLVIEVDVRVNQARIYNQPFLGE